ncbi:MAG: hypothetical protein R3C01_05325 [Planctomycetaceae bacterium]
MKTRDFVAMVFLAAKGGVQGKTKLQKLVYFVGILTGKLEDLGYRPHFYGPYSEEVAQCITHLKTIGALEQQVSEWGCNSSGFEIRRYDFSLTSPGQMYANAIRNRNSDTWAKIEEAFTLYNASGDKDYMTLSIAAKTYFLLDQKLGQKRAPASNQELSRLASKFGWTVSEQQVSSAVDYLVELKLVDRVYK